MIAENKQRFFVTFLKGALKLKNIIKKHLFWHVAGATLKYVSVSETIK